MSKTLTPKDVAQKIYSAGTALGLSTNLRHGQLSENYSHGYGCPPELGKCVQVRSELGYNCEPPFAVFDHLWKTNPVAKRVVSSPVDATWADPPEIKSGDEESGQEFSDAVRELTNRLRIWDHLERLDRLSGVGQYGVLALGFNDVSDGEGSSRPVEANQDELSLQWLRAYTEGSAKITGKEKSTSEPRFGLPTQYTIGSGGKTDLKYHHSRTIHVAENLSESRYLGSSRMQCVFSYICNLEVLCGGAAAMYWRNAKPYRFLGFDGTAEITQEVIDKIKDPSWGQQVEKELEKMESGASAWAKAFGFKVNELSGFFADPSAAVDCNFEMISVGTNMPLRILRGSEVGERSSEEDSKRWGRYILGRQNKHVEHNIIRPFFDKMIELRILPEPPDGEYDVSFPDPTAPTLSEKLDNAKKAADTLGVLINTGAADFINFEAFAKSQLCLDDDIVIEDPFSTAGLPREGQDEALEDEE